MKTRTTKKTTLAPLPRLKPGQYSLYAVMNRIIAEILKEPARLNMQDWLFLYRGKYVDDGDDIWIESRAAKRRETVREMKAAATVPMCGTVGCFAGWGGVLLGKKVRDGFDFLLPFATRAERRFERDYGEFHRDSTLEDLSDLFGYGGWQHKPGTKEYAVEVTDAFKAFMRANEADLRKRFVTVK